MTTVLGEMVPMATTGMMVKTMVVMMTVKRSVEPTRSMMCTEKEIAYDYLYLTAAFPGIVME